MSTPARTDCIDTRTHHDQQVPGLYDVTSLHVEDVQRIVVTDLYNRCVKSFYTTNNTTCNSRLQLDNVPWGLTLHTDNRVMFAVPDSRQIVTVALTPDLVYVSSLQLEKSYYSLAMTSPSRLAAGGFGYVDILNLEGEVVNSVPHSHLYPSPRYMSLTNGHLLVSDWGKNNVICTSEEGPIWTYTGTGRGRLKSPRGTTTTGDGSILVADPEMRKVVQLTQSGEYVRDLLTRRDGIGYPWGIHADRCGALFVCDLGKILKFILGPN